MSRTVTETLRRLIPQRAAALLRSPAFLGCLFWALVVGLAWAADVVLQMEKRSPVPYERFGWSIALIGDINGDGIRDLAVGAPGTPGAPIPYPGAVYIYSGSDASSTYIRQHLGDAVSEDYGYAVAHVGDLDQDGFPEYIIGAPRAGDAVMGEVGKAYLLSGHDGATVTTFIGRTPRSGFGAAVAGGADLDLDGFPDVAVGAPFDDALGLGATGAVFVYSGASLAPLYEKSGDADGDRFGQSIAILRRCCAGDESSEAIFPADLIVGAPGADVDLAPIQLIDAGKAYVFTGPAGAPLRIFQGDASSTGFGATVRSAGDWDGDGRPELGVGAPWAESAGIPGRRGAVYLFYGGPFAPFRRIEGEQEGEEFGRAILASLDPFDAQSTPMLFVGAPGAGAMPPLPGRVYVYQGGQVISAAIPAHFAQPSGSAPGEQFGRALAVCCGGNESTDSPFGRSGLIAVGAPDARMGPIVPTGAVRFYEVVTGPPPGVARRIGLDDDASTDGTLVLDWQNSTTTCAGTDFAVYQGQLLDIGRGLDRHVPLTCSTGDATSVLIPPSAFQQPGTALYFIPVPLTFDEEGSYGQGTLGNEHPISMSPCRPYRNLQTCPAPPVP